jgi:hypothetical protein
VVETVNEKGNPENLTPWKPGESGNPKGRPPKEEAVTDILRNTVDKQALVNKLIELALNGDKTALTYCIDRLDGKPRETVHQMIENLPEVVEVDLTDHADPGDAPVVEE